MAAARFWPALSSTAPALPAAPRCFRTVLRARRISRPSCAISRHLADQGLTVLRYDFTGLGESKGDFSETNFSTQRLDVIAASKYLADQETPPQLLIGHSLGGAASLAAASEIPSLRAIALIAAPAETQHLAQRIAAANPDISRLGVGEFTVGGATYKLRRQLIEDLRSYDLEADLRALQLPLLIMHSPADTTLSYQHARRLMVSTLGPTSLITLDGADHLLVDQPGDVEFVARMISTWFSRYERPA